MANLGKIVAVMLLLLFVTKAVAVNVFPLVKNLQQELVLDENQESEESDDLLEFKFLDVFLQVQQPIYALTLCQTLVSKKSMSVYNCSLNIGHHQPAFRPPCKLMI